MGDWSGTSSRAVRGGRGGWSAMTPVRVGGPWRWWYRWWWSLRAPCSVLGDRPMGDTRPARLPATGSWP